ncbi:unnamed protein product [Cylindrotheca closterium]|uniref:Methyltransferase type 11 domain-containing protein n=1 Tax=Cylindrotheca closterium TaxID=2856 RepID=A0AAD2FJM2_9STRA|nr:unnamed protein product [Cylindrotheca closterium]
MGDDDNVYETDASVNMYLGLHYPSSGEKEGVSAILPHTNAPTSALRFPQRVGGLLQSLEPTKTNGKALDIGCAVGGSSFQLAKTFDHVDAFDYSHAFVQMAQRMQGEESITFKVPIESDIHETVQSVHEEGITAKIRSKVQFFQGDACQIPEMVQDGKLTTYDGVIMSNLLCRLKDPMACLRGIASIVNRGGVVVIVTPFSWLTEFTSRENWLGGYYHQEEGTTEKPVQSKDVLTKVMEAEGFEKVHDEEMPLIIREHQRKYQYIVSQATGWRKK